MMSAMAHLPLSRLYTALSSAAAEGGDQFGLWAGRVGHLLWWSDDASLAVEFRYPGEPRSAGLDKLRVECLIATDCVG